MNNFQFGDRGRAQAFDFREPSGGRRDHFREGAKARDQGLGKRVDVSPWNCAKQHALEQLIVAEGFRAGIPKALPQPLAMAVIMRRGFWAFRHETKLARKHLPAVSAERTSTEVWTTVIFSACMAACAVRPAKT